MTNPDHLDDSLAAVRKARELLHRARAVIFDFDGLLVDTEYAIYSSWERVFASWRPRPPPGFVQPVPGERLHPLEPRGASGTTDGPHLRLGSRQRPPPGGNRPRPGARRPSARSLRTHPEPGGSRNAHGRRLQLFPPLGGRLAEQAGHHALFPDRRLP